MFIDIAFNATDSTFNNNLDEIMINSKENNVLPILVGLDIESSNKVLKLAEKYNTFCYLGVHQLHLCCQNSKATFPFENNIEEYYTSGQSKWDNYLGIIENKIGNLDYLHPRVIGIGECGLDLFRDNNLKEQTQIFKAHLKLNSKIDLPYFFHCRNAYKELESLIIGTKGVIHSFDGTYEEAEKFIKMGFYIGINGCSLKTEENLKVIEKIPLERILLETDSPYCMIRKVMHLQNILE